MLRDIRYAVRSLLRWKLGSATSLYAFLRAALGASVPAIEGIEAVGRLYAANRTFGVDCRDISLADYRNALVGATSFEALAAHTVSDRLVLVSAEREHRPSDSSPSSSLACSGPPSPLVASFLPRSFGAAHPWPWSARRRGGHGGRHGEVVRRPFGF
jgi:hypothetical protein